jgi:hypothetical protein
MKHFSPQQLAVINRVAAPFVARSLGRAYTRDMLTFDNRAHEMIPGTRGDARGITLDHSYGRPFGYTYTGDGSMTCDSTGAYLVGELERLDQTLHEPLAAISWDRDIDLREDVTIADDISSFTLSTYASAGGLGTGNGIGNGKAWIGKTTDQVTGVGVDIAKLPFPLTPWGIEIKYTIFELESAAKVGRPIDQQKYNGMKLKHDMDIDEQVYIGDTSAGFTGLLNNTLVTNVTNLPAGAGGSTLWSTKTPDEVLADFNFAITSVWSASAWAKMPNKILVPPTQFGALSTAKVSNAGNISVIKYIEENNVVATSGKGKLDIQPCKWNIGAGVGGTVGTADGHDRMLVYTQDKDMVRFPMTLLQRTPVQYESIYHKCTYFCKLGVVEVVYPETIGYFDGL